MLFHCLLIICKIRLLCFLFHITSICCPHPPSAVHLRAVIHMSGPLPDAVYPGDSACAASPNVMACPVSRLRSRRGGVICLNYLLQVALWMLVTQPFDYRVPRNAQRCQTNVPETWLALKLPSETWWDLGLGADCFCFSARWNRLMYWNPLSTVCSRWPRVPYLGLCPRQARISL